MTDHAELIEPSPVDRGEFVGDIFYGDPSNSTRGTHRWTGAAWEALPTDADALTLMLAEARARIAALVAERDALAAEVAKLREALKPFADYAKAYDEYSLAQFGLIELDTHVMGNVHRGSLGHPKDIVLIAGDLRRARAALAQEPRNV